MRIGIDARLIGYRRGIGTAVYNLLRSLSEIAQEHEFVLYVDSMQSRKAIPEVDHFIIRYLPVSNYVIFEQFVLPWQAMRDELEILHCPANTGPLWLPRSTRLVLTIHDVIYFLPDIVVPSPTTAYQRLGRIYRRLLVPRVARRAALITTPSLCSKRDILYYLHVDDDKVIVVQEAAKEVGVDLPGAGEIDQTKQEYGIRGRYILALGGADPRKNVAGILAGFRSFKRSSVKCEHQLAIVGLSKTDRAGVRAAACRLGLEEDLVMAEFVDERQLESLYCGAEMFLYVSLYEGFGLPVLEAMSCGTAVVASNVSSIPEVTGDAALLVEPSNAAEIGRAMVRVARDKELRESLVKLGLGRAREYSWERSAREMLKVYENVGQS